MRVRASYPDLPEGRDLPRRPFRKPFGRKWSEYIFGRRLNIAHFQKYGWVRVRAYRLADGRVFYTDPIRGSHSKHKTVIGEFIIRKKPA